MFIQKLSLSSEIFFCTTIHDYTVYLQLKGTGTEIAHRWKKKREEP
jgi:hypothetical protein